jgi:hypothetical protein
MRTLPLTIGTLLALLPTLAAASSTTFFLELSADAEPISVMEKREGSVWVTTHARSRVEQRVTVTNGVRQQVYTTQRGSTAQSPVPAFVPQVLHQVFDSALQVVNRVPLSSSKQQAFAARLKAKHDALQATIQNIR